MVDQMDLLTFQWQVVRHRIRIAGTMLDHQRHKTLVHFRLVHTRSVTDDNGCTATETVMLLTYCSFPLKYSSKC